MPTCPSGTSKIIITRDVGVKKIGRTPIVSGAELRARTHETRNRDGSKAIHEK